MQQTLLSYFFFAVTLMLCACLATSQNIEPQERENYFNKELRNDVSQLLLKKLRFRNVDSVNDFDQMQKRTQQRLVNNLAAFLSSLKQQRQPESVVVRIPSLRFGK